MAGSAPRRVLLVDTHEAWRRTLKQLLEEQGYAVETAADPATGADLALSAPPAVVLANLWMPSISGVQLCRLLRAEPATAETPVILIGPADDRRSRFWAHRAGATAYIAKERTAELLEAVASAAVSRPEAGEFFMQLSGGSVDVLDRIARHLDAALCESVLAGEVRALASSGSFEALFRALSALLSQLVDYRWMSLRTARPGQMALHCHPHARVRAESEAREVLWPTIGAPTVCLTDETAHAAGEPGAAIVQDVCFDDLRLGTIAITPLAAARAEADALVSLVARELGGSLRMTLLVEEAQRLATTDPLTGSLNRRAFMSVMAAEAERRRRYGVPVSLLLLDVDHFKAINDQHGHAAGDQVLRVLGEHLRDTLRGTDVSARWGGEEFVVAFANTALEDAALAAERLRSTILECVLELSEASLRLTVSMGLAELGEAEPVDALIERADQAMYAAKRGGRNRLIVAEQGGELRAMPDRCAADAGSQGAR